MKSNNFFCRQPDIVGDKVSKKVVSKFLIECRQPDIVGDKYKFRYMCSLVQDIIVDSPI